MHSYLHSWVTRRWWHLQRSSLPHRVSLKVLVIKLSSAFVNSKSATTYCVSWKRWEEIVIHFEELWTRYITVIISCILMVAHDCTLNFFCFWFCNKLLIHFFYWTELLCFCVWYLSFFLIPSIIWHSGLTLNLTYTSRVFLLFFALSLTCRDSFKFHHFSLLMSFQKICPCLRQINIEWVWIIYGKAA